MVPSPNDVATSFRNWLVANNSGLAWNSQRGDWARHIKEFFDHLGTQEGFRVVYTRQGVKEYLLDLTWIQETPRRYIELGLESEMSENRARCLRAFDKLTDTKANTKVGIFRTNTTLENQLFELFRQRLTNHSLPIPTERYLVVFLSYDTNQKQIKVTCHLLGYLGDHSTLCDDRYLFPEN
jgi:hypothetical protein